MYVRRRQQQQQPTVNVGIRVPVTILATLAGFYQNHKMPTSSQSRLLVQALEDYVRSLTRAGLAEPIDSPEAAVRFMKQTNRARLANKILDDPSYRKYLLNESLEGLNNEEPLSKLSPLAAKAAALLEQGKMPGRKDGDNP